MLRCDAVRVVLCCVVLDSASLGRGGLGWAVDMVVVVVHIRISRF